MPKFPKKLFVTHDEDIDTNIAFDSIDDIGAGEEYSVYELKETKEKPSKRGNMPRGGESDD